MIERRSAEGLGPLTIGAASIYPAGQGWAWGKEAAETCCYAENSDHSQRQNCTTKAVSRSEVSVLRRPSRELHSFLYKFTTRGGSTPGLCLNGGLGRAYDGSRHCSLHRSKKYLIVF